MPHWVAFATVGTAGLFIGSFLNVVIYRGPSAWRLIDDPGRGGLVRPSRSYCPACGTTLRVRDLLPIASYLFLKGRCGSCAAPISGRYPIAEALGGIVPMLSVAAFDLTLAGAAAALFGWMLIALAFIDLETGYLPDALTLPAIAVGLGVNAVGVFVPFTDALIGAAAGYGVFAAIAAIFRRLRGVDGLGLGDAKLLAAIGAFAGWPALAFVTLGASLLTLAAAGVARARGAAIGRTSALRFGPGLCAAGFAALLFVRIIYP